ncbi:MAG: HIT family protein [Betaproteobacteria bacterium]|nr:HIT family protein [Betaproteobacteria bacterium]MBU6512880.1 HIT family protein [Betaproteobacteria bacterium]MDE1955209.1 HIT family protein [Betaproteobacteria bacterium]
MSAAPDQGGGADRAGACPLCAQAGGLPVWTSAWMRLIRADEPLHPATWRLVWNEHVAEFSELPKLRRLACMDALVLVERELREALRPRKINLAALGNLVPHLHWHLIARWDWDAHWPQPVWAPARREPDAARLAALRESLPAIDARLREVLERRFGT